MRLKNILFSAVIIFNLTSQSWAMLKDETHFEVTAGSYQVPREKTGANITRISPVDMEECLRTITTESTHVTSLKVHGRFSPEQADAFIGAAARTLSGNENIKTLTLWAKAFNDGHIAKLVPIIRTMHSLEVLFLDQNPITVNGIQSLAEFLKENPPLKYLGLTDTYMDNNGVMPLSFIFEMNKNLQSIYMDKPSFNAITGAFEEYAIVMNGLARNRKLIANR